jgi:hypothetical protein
MGIGRESGCRFLKVFLFVFKGFHAGHFFEMTVEIGNVIEAAFETDNTNRIFVFHQHTARMTDPNLHQEVEVGFPGHHFKMAAKGDDAGIASRPPVHK